MRFLRCVLATALMSITPALAALTGAALDPPASLTEELHTLHEIRRVEKLPLVIQRGMFAGANGGKSASEDWKLAEPGGPWRATDIVIDPKLPSRRLLFAACNLRFCILHYEHGGIGENERILGLLKTGKNYKVIWDVVGFQVVGSLIDLQYLVKNKTLTSFQPTQDAY